MHGGVGRYTHNLAKSLRLNNLDVKVLSDSHGSGDYIGLSPHNKQNSELLLNIVQDYKPDIVHIQHEHGLYGFYLNPLYPPKTSTGLDKFYDKCTVPIVTTFHTSMHFKQWMQLVNTKECNSRDILRLHVFYKIWKQLINYTSLHRINKRILAKSAYGIVFSEYMKALIPGTNLIFHGSEPWSNAVNVSQKEARDKLGLPPRGRLALAQGHLTSTKGWDIIRNMNLPKNWKLVVNYSKNFYNTENDNFDLNDSKISDQVINLNKQYLSEEELSLLLFSCDAVFLPYKVSSGSGVMYDGLAHGKPFIASDIGFFKEFSEMNLGIATRREPHSFEKALVELEKNYNSFESTINEFKQKINWSVVARQHHLVYKNIMEKQKITIEIASTKHIPQYSYEY